MAHFLVPSTRSAMDAVVALDDGAGTNPLDRLRAIRSLQDDLEHDPAGTHNLTHNLTTDLNGDVPQ